MDLWIASIKKHLWYNFDVSIIMQCFTQVDIDWSFDDINQLIICSRVRFIELLPYQSSVTVWVSLFSSSFKHIWLFVNELIIFCCAYLIAFMELQISPEWITLFYFYNDLTLTMIGSILFSIWNVWGHEYRNKGDVHDCISSMI